MVRSVRLSDISHYSYGVRPDCIHTNCANCPACAETNFYQAGSTAARKQADRRSVVRWDELPLPVPSLEEPIRMPLDQTPDLFAPDKSTYYTARRTSCCPREPLTNNTRTHSREGTCERRTLAFDSSVESQGEESVPRRRAKNDEVDAKVSSTQHPPKSSKSSAGRTKDQTNAKVSSTQHSPRSSTKSKSQKRRTFSS